MAKLLRRISIESPCSASWEEMTGNDQVRWCRHCDLKVRDLSQLTRSQASKLVLKSQGRLCLRIHRNQAGDIITRPAVQTLHSISRRASRIAAGAFTAVMSLSTAAYAQSGGSADTTNEPPVVEQTFEVTEVEIDTRSFVSEYGVSGGVVVMAEYEQPLVKAAYEGDMEAIDRLLAGGENVNQAEEDGTTALELAVGRNNVEMVRRLLRAGANVTTTDEQGQTILFSLGDGSTLEMVALLVYAGANVNQPDHEGNTPLINAAESDSEELIQALINAGAYVNAQNKVGNSALMVAAEHGNAGTLDALLEAGAIYGLRNADNADAMQLAQINGHEEICEILRDAGVVPSTPQPVEIPIMANADIASGLVQAPARKRKE